MRKIFTKKRVIITTIILLLLLGVIAIIKFTGGPAMPKTTIVTRQNLSHSLNISGKIKAGNQVDVVPEASGKIIYIAVKEGDVVKLGQLLAQLDNRVLVNNLEQAMASVAKYQSAQKELWETYKIETQTNIIQEKLNQAEQNVQAAILAQDAAQLALNKSYIYSPINGTVVSLPVSTGQYAATTVTKLATVVDTTKLYFEAELDEEDLEIVTMIPSARVTLDAYQEKSWAGKLISIKGQTEINTDGNSVIKVKLELSPEPTDLTVGLGGSAEFTLDEVKQVLAIPFEALVSQQGENYAYVFKSRFLAEKVKIQTDFENDYFVEVTQGLNDGDTVALDLPEKLTKKTVIEFKH